MDRERLCNIQGDLLLNHISTVTLSLLLYIFLNILLPHRVHKRKIVYFHTTIMIQGRKQKKNAIQRKTENVNVISLCLYLLFRAFVRKLWLGYPFMILQSSTLLPDIESIVNLLI